MDLIDLFFYLAGYILVPRAFSPFSENRRLWETLKFTKEMLFDWFRLVTRQTSTSPNRVLINGGA
jgi:hypothetical protein